MGESWLPCASVILQLALVTLKWCLRLLGSKLVQLEYLAWGGPDRGEVRRAEEEDEEAEGYA